MMEAFLALERLDVKFQAIYLGLESGRVLRGGHVSVRVAARDVERGESDKLISGCRDRYDAGASAKPGRI